MLCRSADWGEAASNIGIGQTVPEGQSLPVVPSAAWLVSRAWALATLHCCTASFPAAWRDLNLITAQKPWIGGTVLQLLLQQLLAPVHLLLREINRTRAAGI